MTSTRTALPNLRQRRRRGIAWVELVLGLGFVAVLAAIAVPNYRYMQLHSKRAELAVHVERIRSSENLYVRAFGRPVACPLAPRPDAELDGVAVTFHLEGAWAVIGFQPEGLLRGNYEVRVEDGVYTVEGKIDVDDDNVLARAWATQLNPFELESRGSRVY